MVPNIPQRSYAVAAEMVSLEANANRVIVTFHSRLLKGMATGMSLPGLGLLRRKVTYTLN